MSPLLQHLLLQLLRLKSPKRPFTMSPTTMMVTTIWMTLEGLHLREECLVLGVLDQPHHPPLNNLSQILVDGRHLFQ